MRWSRHALRPAFLLRGILLFVLISAGCQGVVEPRTDEPVVEGTVAERIEDGTFPKLRLDHLDEANLKSTWGELLDGLGPDERNHLWLYVTIPPIVFRQQRSGLIEVSPDDIKVGDRIQAWADMATRSLPPWYFGVQIVILQ